MISNTEFALRPWECVKYEIVRDYVECGEIANKNALLCRLNCCSRTLKNMVNGYKEMGEAFFVHGNRGRKPVHALTKKEKQAIVKIYKEDYPDASFAYAVELLSEHNDIEVHPSTVRKILMAEDIVSPFATKKTKRIVAKRLREKAKNAKRKDIAEVADKIERAENKHPKREKSASAGQMIQLDASEHLWLESAGVKWHLHGGIDDASGNVVGLYFDRQETLKGYYNVGHQILMNYGIPAMFYTDGRTVFEYKKKCNSREAVFEEVEKDYFTQFGYACWHLGIEIKTTHIPQAKGKIERLWGTLQQRLPIAMRRAGIRTIEEANIFLVDYIRKYNAKFGLPMDSFPSLFAPAPAEDDIMKILAVINERIIDGGHSVRYKNKSYRTIGENGFPCYLKRKTKGLIIESFDEQLYFSVSSPNNKETIYSLEVIPEHEQLSHNILLAGRKTNEPRKINIPKANHPWRLDSWERHLKRQKHRNAIKMAN
ncbi:MAG: ISNCY family transposase [Lachnospiraceae bacterium]|nr:ISNCY family transposase [Lachnospiraceae bacterium]